MSAKTSSDLRLSVFEARVSCGEFGGGFRQAGGLEEIKLMTSPAMGAVGLGVGATDGQLSRDAYVLWESRG